MKKVFEDKGGTFEAQTRGKRTVELVWTPKVKGRKLERILFRADEAKTVLPAWIESKKIPTDPAGLAFLGATAKGRVAR